VADIDHEHGTRLATEYVEVRDVEADVPAERSVNRGDGT
jgi:hypothetical protein